MNRLEGDNSHGPTYPLTWNGNGLAINGDGVVLTMGSLQGQPGTVHGPRIILPKQPEGFLTESSFAVAQIKGEGFPARKFGMMSLSSDWIDRSSSSSISTSLSTRNTRTKRLIQIKFFSDTYLMVQQYGKRMGFFHPGPQTYPHTCQSW